MRIDDLSKCSLFIELAAKGNKIANATGSIILHKQNPYLITNRHVVTFIDPQGARANELTINYHSTKGLGSWIKKIEPLYDSNGNYRWIEHPDGNSIDVIALPLRSNDSDIRIFFFDLSLAQADMLAAPSMPVSIIGFPFGLTMAGGWPIWKTGHIASDPDLDYDQKPSFIIDATTRPGMSGSPVVLRSYTSYVSKNGIYNVDGKTHTRFMGVYSGRLRDDSEIGLVWSPKTILDILD